MKLSNPMANAVRALCMDAIEKAQSGHPGAPLGMADIAYTLWTKHLKHNPSNPGWFNRDRFVLSNGHGSMLLYALLHLTGYDLPIDELKRFRQLHSKTPGHPEYSYTPGVETTTGPLGQGLANAVGMAIAEKVLAAQFNKPEFSVVDHYTYCFAGDGCLMEGISHEACSLAGTLGLEKLIVFWDDNGISIDGEVRGWFTDDTQARFQAYGWQVIANVDGHDNDAIDNAILEAKKSTGKPTLICCKTVIGAGSPNKAGKNSSHGSPLGESEIQATRKALNWHHEPFNIPSDIRQQWDARETGEALESEWNTLFKKFNDAHPEFASEFSRRIEGQLPEDFSQKADSFIHSAQAAMQPIATRKASQNAIEFYAGLLPEIIGGSADLSGSNLTMWNSSQPITAENASGNYLFYGVREFGMTAIANGISIHSGFKPFSATFLIFMEYARNAVRMSALMGIPNIFVYTHDSIGQGEDGPTHQPIEQLATLRMTPNLDTWRPCDAAETAVAWKMALMRSSGPSALVFSRQSVKPHIRNEEQLSTISKGGYTLKAANGEPDIILIATGSEVSLAIEAAEQLSNKHGVKASVVSLPSPDVFLRQESTYQEQVLPSHVTCRLAIEAAHVDYWHKFVGPAGEILGLDSFGESAPGDVLFSHFGFTVENVIARAEKALAKHAAQ